MPKRPNLFQPIWLAILLVIILLFLAVLMGCSTIPGPSVTGGDRSGGIISGVKGFGRFLGELVVGQPAPGPGAHTPSPDLGMGVFTFTGGIGLLGVMVFAFLERRVRFTLLLLAGGIALVPAAVALIWGAANWLVGLAATIAAVGLCVWAVQRGLEYRRLRGRANLARIDATNGASDEEKAWHLVKAEAIEDLIKT